VAQAKIFSKTKSFLGFIVSKNIFYSKAYYDPYRLEIKDGKRFSRILKAKNYPISRFVGEKRDVLVKQQLPFRVKFINIGIESYGPNNPPPIGIAVIGFNNYIL
jgi:hypothetical protein